jgi:hypothetical protein
MGDSVFGVPSLKQPYLGEGTDTGRVAKKSRTSVSALACGDNHAELSTSRDVNGKRFRMPYCVAVAQWLQAPISASLRPASDAWRWRCAVVRDANGARWTLLLACGLTGWESRSKNRCNASRLVHRVPPICITSRTTPRHPAVAQRYNVETCVLRPLRRRGKAAAAWFREIRFSVVVSIMALASSVASY